MHKNNSKYPVLLGAHISIAGGLHQSINRALSIDCTCMQIFTKSNRQWRAKPINHEDAQLFIEQKEKAKNKLHTIAVHASYLINLASASKDIQLKSIDALTEELNRCAQLQLPYLVLHPGSNNEQDIDTTLDMIATNLKKSIQQSTKQTTILLENTAGQGTSVGYKFEHLAKISQALDNIHKIGYCIDTCHAFAAGYEFNTYDTYKKFWHEIESVLKVKNVKLMHINDSKKPCNSRIDRHENIGEGKIGIQAFKFIMNDPKLKLIPKILETPKTTINDDKKNMQKLLTLII